MRKHSKYAVTDMNGVPAIHGFSWLDAETGMVSHHCPLCGQRFTDEQADDECPGYECPGYPKEVEA